MSKKYRKQLKKLLIIAIFLLCLMIIEYFNPGFKQYINDIYVQNTTEVQNLSTYKLSEIPEYEGNPYIIINDNIPNFNEEDYATESFEKYSELDVLGRCGIAFANICKDIMPPEGDERGNINSVEPTGWKQKKYDGEYLYNRCHLIGYQLSDEDANKLNLITGTRYFNVNGMLPFENEVADYIKENENNHVLYRVTPIFEESNLVAKRCTNGGLFC